MAKFAWKMITTERTRNHLERNICGQVALSIASCKQRHPLGDKPVKGHVLTVSPIQCIGVTSALNVRHRFLIMYESSQVCFWCLSFNRMYFRLVLFYQSHLRHVTALDRNRLFR